MKAARLMSAVGALGLFAAFVVGCASTPQQGDKRLSNADVSLISFGSLHGEVAPCG